MPKNKNASQNRFRLSIQSFDNCGKILDFEVANPSNDCKYLDTVDLVTIHPK